MDEASHLPFGVPVNEPSFASACWISEMRSGVGAFCPRSRRPDFFDDFERCEELDGLEVTDFFGVAFCACAEAAHTPSPAATSSVRARCFAFLTSICVCVSCRYFAIADCRP